MKTLENLLLLLAASKQALSAVNLDGSQALDPVSEDDPSPIADPITYVPDQHDCPLPCSVDFANVHKWTPFYSIDRLKRCELPMLLQFSVLRPLDDVKTDILIRSCSLKSDPVAAKDRSVINAVSMQIDNPKNSTDLFEVSLDVAPACAIEGKEVKGELTVTTAASTSKTSSKSNIDALSLGIKQFFEAKDNCDETFIFGYNKMTVAGVYIGAGLGKKTVPSAVDAVIGAGGIGTTTAQLCTSNTTPETVFGLVFDASGDLAKVQKTAVGWSMGSCAPAGASASTTRLDVRVFDIAAMPLDSHHNDTISGNSTLPAVSNKRSRSIRTSFNGLAKRATCKYIQVQTGDGCASLASKCGIKGADFTKFNPKTNLCSTLLGGDYVCCSAGDPYTPPKPDPPKPDANGNCAAHLIQDGDTCQKLAQTYGITVEQIESFNKGKTWGWTECKGMMSKYNMCLSKGDAPLPPAQQGTECGPLVPGTNRTDKSIPMAELNPCPLKACCSNWGYCGPFPSHCDIHAPAGGGPGTKLPEFESTCISNCGNEIKQNSGPPVFFSRIGYYESWNMGRKCLWLKAENANTDSTYTHIHWGFLEIDPTTWKPVIKDPHKQWQKFKMLANVKRIVSFGGWAYSTEPVTYNIIRQAIITNREVFAANIAKFVEEEKIDGVDIDWEYPGAPDILVDGKPIGQPGDGVAYLRFLTSLKSKLGSTKSVSIAAPASYWYLKAFPIDRIANVIDYIVFMTYDLHGQWDYGNVNAFDSCPSGKCIRSHVNLTETSNTLSIITKAGVPNNKIFVGEASYGRSFHMATDGCWGPTCDFTGTRLQSDAKPGRCTDTKGYISLAEINDILRSQKGDIKWFHDAASNSDILLYNGDYISYMTSTTKDTRRKDWEKLNFAGSIDWAVDLQAFGIEDAEVPPEIAPPGKEGCVVGSSFDLNAMDLCEFACSWGFCPEPICYCSMTDTVSALPNPVSTEEFISWDDFDMGLMRLCKFGCKYGFCPRSTCGKPVVDQWEDGSFDSDQPDSTQVDDGLWNKDKNFQEDMSECQLFQKAEFGQSSIKQCETPCWNSIQQAKAEGRTTSYGCIGQFPLDKEIPWHRLPGQHDGVMMVVEGKCSCDNLFVNWIADNVLDAMPIIAQIGCYIVMSTVKIILDVGLEFIPGVGKILDAGMDAVAIAAQMAAYAFPPDQDPAGAFEWWLSPCGGSDLVPEEIKKVFGIMSSIADGVSSFKPPKNIPKGSAKKGDPANPKDRSKPKAGTGSGPNGRGSSGVNKKKKCSISPADRTVFMGEAKNTLRVQKCTGPPGGVSTTTKEVMVITSLEFGSKPTTVLGTCPGIYTQACYHYSSAIARNPAWGVLKCPHGNVANKETSRPGPKAWQQQHHKRWMQRADRAYKGQCDIDEYPPRYLLSDSDPEIAHAGTPKGQLMRYLPHEENRDAARMWRGACFMPHIKAFSGPGKEDDFMDKWKSGKKGPLVKDRYGNWQRKAIVPVDVMPSFKIEKFEHAAHPFADAGMWENPCWPTQLAAEDPGFTLFNFDQWYDDPTHPHWFDFSVPP